jgi:hypothetical protein
LSASDAVRRRHGALGRNPIAGAASAAYIALHRRSKPASSPRKESTMNSPLTRPIAAQVVSLSLALLATVSTLWGLNSLATAETAAPQQMAAAAAPRA